MLTSCAGNIYHIILNATENIPYTLRRVSKQSRSSVEYLRLFLYSVYSNAQIRPGKIYMYGKLFVQEFCPVYIFWNISRRQAITTVAKFRHVLGRGFMIQRVILIFIKNFSGNQN